jgi:nicotinamide-nucleotide amidase
VAIVTRNLKTFGISEGALDEILSPLFRSKNPYLGIYSKQDGIHLRAIATARNEEEGRKLIAPMEAEIRRVIGDAAIWGTDNETPESRLAQSLTTGNRTLGIVEGFTGGLIASALHESPEGQARLKGSMVTTNRDVWQTWGVDARLIDKHGPASAQVAEALARAAAQRFGADTGLSITGTVTEPTPNSGPPGTCCIGFYVDGAASSTSGRYPTQRLRMRSRAATHAMLGLVQVLRQRPLSGETVTNEREQA